jgi:GMP synthase-like glutamine amidotransferase
MIDLLIIQHEKKTPPGSVLEWAHNHQLHFKIWNIFDSQETYKPEDAKSVIICGGTMDTFEEAEFPWLIQEKKFIQDCIQAKKPIFGLCLGSQLLAETLGGKVYSMNKWELGFIPVNILDKQKNILETLQVFHWHQYTFDLPPEAQLLATNDFCPHQGFTFGNNIIATQFHPEATTDWIKACAESIGEKKYEGLVQSKKEIYDNLNLQKDLQKWFFKQLNEWFPF